MFASAGPVGEGETLPHQTVRIVKLPPNGRAIPPSAGLRLAGRLFAVGDAPAAPSVLQACSATVQQSSPQSLSTSTECNFPVNWYEFALTGHQIQLQGVPPGWQVNYQQNGTQSLAFVATRRRDPPTAR